MAPHFLRKKNSVFFDGSKRAVEELRISIRWAPMACGRGRDGPWIKVPTWGLHTFGCGSKLNGGGGYAGFSLWFHLLGLHFGAGFLSHSHSSGKPTVCSVLGPSEAQVS